MAAPNVKPLLVIVGPTASGKTALAIKLAQKFDGEIICADSRTIYKGMDIGTAKPTVPEMAGIPHHLLSIIEPDESFTVADFKLVAERAIDDIHQKGKVPILVGGSGLYIDAVIFDYKFDASSERSERNPRHASQGGNKSSLRSNTLVLGLDVAQEIHLSRIVARIDAMVAAGLVDEARAESKSYGWDIEAMKTYLPLREYLDGSETLEQATEKMVIKDRQLAKKQRTWFNRNNSIHWVHDLREAVALVTTFLNNYT